jgi:hypothetical protein
VERGNVEATLDRLTYAEVDADGVVLEDEEATIEGATAGAVNAAP